MIKNTIKKRKIYFGTCITFQKQKIYHLHQQQVILIL